MGFHDRAVDQIKIVARFRRQRVENSLPDPASRPPVEAIVSRRIGPIPLGQITPRHPRAQHVEYRVHYPSIVHPATLPTARHERLQQSPLLVTQIKPHDPPPTTVNHDPLNLSSNYLGTNPKTLDTIIRIEQPKLDPSIPHAQVFAVRDGETEGVI